MHEMKQIYSRVLACKEEAELDAEYSVSNPDTSSSSPREGRMEFVRLGDSRHEVDGSKGVMVLLTRRWVSDLPAH